MLKEKHYAILSEIEFGEITKENLTDSEFEILSAGKKVYRGGEIEIKESDLSDFEKNFNENVVGTQLAVDKNHDPDHQAFAWFASVRKSGNKLLAKFKDFTEEGKKLILEGGFKYFSVEIDNSFERIIDGTKKSFSNVLRGVALTNRPVDKEIAPTFLSEKLTPKNMQTALKLAESLCKRSFLSKEDKELWNETKATLSDEEQKSDEVQKADEEVQAKTEEKEEEKKDEKKEDEQKEKKEEGKKEELSEKLSASEKKLSEMESELGKMKTEARKTKILAEAKKEFQLSEVNTTGLNEEATAELAEFSSTLSEKDKEKVFALIKKVKTVDFTEHGEAGEGDVDSNKEVMKLAEAKMKSAKEAGESLTLGQAMSDVIAENPTLAE